MVHSFRQIGRAAALAAGSFLLASPILAQAGASLPGQPGPSKFDIYGGYGYFHPVSSYVRSVPYPTVYNINTTVSVTDYFTRTFGLQIEGGYFSSNSPRGIAGQCAYGACSDRDQLFYTAQAGPVFRMQKGRFVPFFHILGGGAKVNGPVLERLTWGYGATAGVGVDIILPYFNNLIAIRPIQADGQYSHVHYGAYTDPVYGGVGDITNIKLSGGLVLRFGNMAPPVPVALACSVQPTAGFPGDPITVTGTPSNLNPKKGPDYTWTSTGGQVTPAGATATIATTGLAPGDYTVSGHLSQGGKPYEQANCTASFTVQAPQPPTLSCSADPSSVTSGGSATITSVGSSPQNRALTYSYSTTAGQITGTGATVTLSTAGTAPGTINITCNVVDDLGKTATANTSVTVNPQQVTQTKTNQQHSICGVSFVRDVKRPARVDNEAKACLDSVALTMQRSTDAKLFIVGSYSSDEQPQTAEERTLNVRQYLTQEKGLNDSQIELRLGDGSGRSVDNVIVPLGETYAGSGTAFDASSIKRHGQAYGVPHQKAHKGKKKKSNS